jgi:hypothetical protein
MWYNVPRSPIRQATFPRTMFPQNDTNDVSPNDVWSNDVFPKRRLVGQHFLERPYLILLDPYLGLNGTYLVSRGLL